MPLCCHHVTIITSVHQLQIKFNYADESHKFILDQYLLFFLCTCKIKYFLISFWFFVQQAYYWFVYKWCIIKSLSLTNPVYPVPSPRLNKYGIICKCFILEGYFFVLYTVYLCNAQRTQNTYKGRQMILQSNRE